MLQQIYEFFGILGVNMTPPQTLGELIPYLLQVGVGLFLTAAAFGVIKSIARAFSPRGW